MLGIKASQKTEQLLLVFSSTESSLWLPATAPQNLKLYIHTKLNMKISCGLTHLKPVDSQPFLFTSHLTWQAQEYALACMTERRGTEDMVLCVEGSLR